MNDFFFLHMFSKLRVLRINCNEFIAEQNTLDTELFSNKFVFEFESFESTHTRGKKINNTWQFIVEILIQL